MDSDPQALPFWCLFLCVNVVPNIVYCRRGLTKQICASSRYRQFSIRDIICLRDTCLKIKNTNNIKYKCDEQTIIIFLSYWIWQLGSSTLIFFFFVLTRHKYNYMGSLLLSMCKKKHKHFKFISPIHGLFICISCFEYVPHTYGFWFAWVRTILWNKRMSWMRLTHLYAELMWEDVVIRL